MDALDRAIINDLQGGFPVSERPYAQAAARLGTDEQTLIERLSALLDNGYLTRFGPMYHAERMGGGLTLAAMRVPPQELDQVAEQLNAFAEVAHNYEREHLFNIWFVLATETPGRIGEVITEIEAKTGFRVYDMPKLEEFYIGLKLEVR